jgi:hypothetical protein
MNVDFICTILKCGPLRLSHSRNCPILGTPPLYLVPDLYAIAASEIGFDRGEQEQLRNFDAQRITFPPRRFGVQDFF